MKRIISIILLAITLMVSMLSSYAVADIGINTLADNHFRELNTLFSEVHSAVTPLKPRTFENDSAEKLPVFSRAEKNSKISTEEEEIIMNMFECINEGAWTDYAMCYAPSVRKEQIDFISDQSNVFNGVGILALSSTDVLGIERLDNYQAYNIYVELADFFASDDSFSCFAVTVDETTCVKSLFYPTGVVKHLVILVKENNQWWIGRTAILPEASVKNDLYGFADYTSCPNSIIMKDENGTISTVSFYDYLFNVVCNEIGNMSSFADNAVYANVIAVKMIGWWAAVKHCYSSDGYDLKYGIVAFMSTNAADSNGQARMAQAINAMHHYYMISSISTGGKLFSANYLAGNYNANYQGSGILRQYGSDYLADNGYTWQQILHYYYDSSSYNHPDCGTVQIKCTSHNYGSYLSNTTHHWRKCSDCGAESAHLTHSWVSHTYYEQCSVCGRIRNTNQLMKKAFSNVLNTEGGK